MLIFEFEFPFEFLCSSYSFKLDWYSVSMKGPNQVSRSSGMYPFNWTAAGLFDSIHPWDEFIYQKTSVWFSMIRNWQPFFGFPCDNKQIMCFWFLTISRVDGSLLEDLRVEIRMGNDLYMSSSPYRGHTPELIIVK